VTTVDKSVAILQTLADNGPRVPLARLQHLTEFPKPTLYRMLRTMVDHGWVRQDSVGTYSVGTHLFTMAGRIYRDFALPPAARQILVDLQSEAPETLHVSAFRHGQLFYVEKLEAPHPYQMASRVGKMQALHSSAIGKAVLALLPPAEAQELLDDLELTPITDSTIVDSAQLYASLQDIRERGYAVDDEEDEEGLRAVGTAICDSSGCPTGGVSVVAPSFQMSMCQARTYVPALLRAARQLEDLAYYPDRVSVPATPKA
jgi:IclR family acetate operon transcriptional repressor